MSSIKCPSCNRQIDLDEVFYKEIEKRHAMELKKQQEEFEKEIKRAREEYRAHLDSIKKKEEQLLIKEREFEKRLNQEMEKRVLEEREKLYKQLRESIKKEQQFEMEALKRELEEKSKEVTKLAKANLEIERLKREQEQLALKVRMEAESEFALKLKQEQQRMQQMLEELNRAKLNQIREEQELKLREKDEQLKQLQKALEEAQKRAQQGSQQTQGEALELTIEEFLKNKFPLDKIEEVKKGAFGADCIQIVNSPEIQNCGIICYESKNAKKWSGDWILKLKQDMQKVNADIGVLVTSVYPKELSHMGFVDGVWVCSLTEFKAVAPLLRESLIRVSQVITKEENRSDKMNLLYNYLTGKEFSMQLRAIVDGFVKMQEELDRERRSLMAAWKRRQKLIDMVLENTTAMYGSLQAIAGSGAIEHIEILELPKEIEEEE